MPPASAAEWMLRKKNMHDIWTATGGMEGFMPTSKDVAKRAGVSVATVSRVYQSPGLVKPETRELVLKTARELDYYPNLLARSLKQSRSNSIGIAVNDFRNPFFFQVIEQMHARLEDTDYQLLTFPPSGNYFSNEKIIRYLHSNQLDAFLFSPMFYSREDWKLFMNARQYCLQLYTDFYDNVDSVTIDDQYGSYLAVKYLLECGHKKILMFNLSTDGEDFRAKGYQNAFQERNLTADPAYILSYSYNRNHTRSVRDDIARLKPTAIISHAETCTIWTLSAFKELNLNYPEDISLISYDDHPWTEVMGITAIAQPITLVGNTIADTVLQALSSGKDKSVIKRKIQPELIRRGSVRRL